MPRILTLLCISVLSLHVTSSFSQGNNQTNIILPSPDVYKFAKYGDLPIDFSSGAMSFSLPVYTIKLGSFSMPISLGYFSNGVKVDETSAAYGMNWMLNGTGVISRIIRGAPDEQGTFYPLTKILSSDNDLHVASSSPGADTERDWFMFNFNGYSGTFYLDTDMRAQYTCDTKLKIETKRVNEPAPNLGGDLGVVGNNNILTFKITTPDGTIYEFGGQQYAERNLQVGYMFDHRSGWYYGTVPSGYQNTVDPVTSFFLHSVTTATGGKLTFEYQDNRYKLMPSISQHAVIENGSTFVYQASGKVYWRNFIQSKTLKKILVKQPQGELITSVEFSSSETSLIDLFYVLGPPESELPFYDRQIIFNNPFEASLAFIKRPLKLDSIVVKDWMGKRVQSVRLSYSSTLDRQFLNEVSFLGKSDSDSLLYSFEYKDRFLLPHVLSASQDYYGYYNGKINQGRIIEPDPNDGVISPSLLLVLSSEGVFGDREPVADYVSYGMLSKITYPTKGYTSIEYEPNYNENKKLLGGARVKYIRDYDGLSHSQSKEFFYHSLVYYPAVRSSLVQTNEPRFNDLPQTTITGRSEYTLSSSAVNSIYSNRKSNNLYNYVTTIFKDGTGYPVGATERNFYTEVDPYPQVILKDLLFSTPAPNVNAWRSGLLLNEKKFVYNQATSNFELKEETKNVYEKYNERLFSNHIVKLTVVDMPGIRSSYSLNAYQEGACDYRKISDTLISYNGTAKFVKFTDYIFSNDTLVQLKETRSNDSKARTTITRYTYVQDLPTRTAAEDSLLKYFRVGIPLKTEMYKDNDLLSTRVVKYKDWGSGVVEPEKISEAYREFPLHEKISINAYDANGNILDLQNASEPREAYLWGYNDLYPVAKVVGTGYDNIKDLVDRSLLKNTNGSFSNQDIRTELNKLFTAVPGTGTLVNTYTYVPLIGTDTETDATGKTTHYEYDGNNRLAWIRDHEDRILKQYKYKFSEESAASPGGLYNNLEKKGVFYKNNCLVGQQGSLVTYTVPANTYSSSVSQSEADRKAQEDVYANGQSFANSNGSCSGASLPVTIYQSAAKSRLITKNSCLVGLTVPVLYSVPAGSYQSDISQEDADRKAESEINVKGQAYANANGICLEQLSGPMDMYIVDPNTWTSYAVGSYYFATSIQELCKFFDPLWVPPPPPFFPIPNPIPTPMNPVVHITLAIHTVNSTPVSYSHSQFNSLTQVAINAFAPDGYYINKQASRSVPAGQRIIYELKGGKLVNLILCQ